MVANYPAIDTLVEVRAGKFRRYHGEGWRQLFDIPTLLKNIRDFFFFLSGTVQSWRLLGKYRPEVVFIKGGFVGVPVGLAAAARHIPYVTHDSDAVPGLANRIIARWARTHAVAMDKKLYPYPPAKTIQTGVPVSSMYQPVSKAAQSAFKQQLGLEADSFTICITGGGLGAVRLNQAVLDVAPELCKQYPHLRLLHIAGRASQAEVTKAYADLGLAEVVQVEGFVTNLHCYSGAADLIICRAGANSLADFAMQQKPCVVVPNPQLTGGHQLKNAQALAQLHAIAVVTEPKLSSTFLPTITRLIDTAAERHALASALRHQARPDAAEALARLILKEIA